MNGEEKEEGQEEELKARDGQEGVGLSVPLYLLQPVSLLQHVVQVEKLSVCPPMSKPLHDNSDFEVVCAVFV